MTKCASPKKRMMIFIMLSVVLALTITSTVAAIGITPSKRVVNYKPGQTLTYGIDIINNGHEELEVTIYPRGEFTDKIKLSTQIVKMTPDEESKRVNVDFRMPDKIDVAGPHTIEIVAIGSTPTPENQKAVIKADLAVISKLVLDVPYPEKYTEAKIYVTDTAGDRPVQITVPVFNKGSEDISQANLKIAVYSSDGTKIDEMTTEKRGIKTGESTKFTLPANKEYQPGDYKAVATIYFDGEQIEVETLFNVGEMAIDLRGLVVNDFKLGGVAKFEMLLYSGWSVELKNVYAEMQITGEDNTVYTDFKTVAIDLPPREVRMLEGYWYTEGISPGIYTAKVTLHYANKISQKEFELEVSDNKIVTRGMKTGEAVTATEDLNIGKSSFLILVIILMLAIITVLIFKLKKKQEPQTKDASSGQKNTQAANPGQKS